MEDFEDRFAEHWHPNVKLTELPRFTLPGQREPRSDDDALDDDRETEPWPQLRLDLTPPSDEQK